MKIKTDLKEIGKEKSRKKLTEELNKENETKENEKCL